MGCYRVTSMNKHFKPCPVKQADLLTATINGNGIGSKN